MVRRCHMTTSGIRGGELNIECNHYIMHTYRSLEIDVSEGGNLSTNSTREYTFSTTISHSIMETTTNKPAGDFYSILLPTYNERDNLPVMIYLIEKYMKKE